MKHRLILDDSSHWFVIPVDMEDEWKEWLAKAEDDDFDPTPPLWAVRVNGSPDRVHFEEFTIE